MQPTTVLLVFGGESAEHDVSVASARNVFAALDDTKYTIHLCYIDKSGRWWSLSTLDGEIHTTGLPQLVPVLGTAQLVTLPESKTIHPDVILAILHGPNGEDGTVQGLAKLLHVPIVGCDVTASAVCMDKILTKRLLSQADLPIVPYQIHTKGHENPDFNKLTMSLGSPLFVKPANLGSSVGISKVYNEDELHKALETAHQYDPKALIEPSISGRELEIAVLGHNENPEVSGVGEIKPQGDFYSYESKYDPTSTSEIIIPAELDEQTAERIRDYAGKAYQTLGCDGLTRVDFFLSDDGTIYINELNTIPGFTNISMYAKLWRERGLNYPQLVERLIALALDKK